MVYNYLIRYRRANRIYKSYHDYDRLIVRTTTEHAARERFLRLANTLPLHLEDGQTITPKRMYKELPNVEIIIY